jgi:Xaa-Pro aminopeptidase
MTPLDALQSQLIGLGLHAVLIPSSDEHLNEYVLPHGNRRAWISGFDGSAGDALITPDQAFLFVDSRYYLQAYQQVDLTRWQVQKLGQPQAKTLADVLTDLATSQPGFTLGACAQTLSMQQASQIQTRLTTLSGKLVPTDGNLIDALWQAQPDYPGFKPSTVYGLPDAVTGQTFEQKLAAVQTGLQQAGADAMAVVRLDQLAWLLNWRGQDVPYNPLFVGYALLTPEGLHLFTDASPLPTLPPVVMVKPYADYLPTLSVLAPRYRWLMDAAHLNWATCLTLPQTVQVKGSNPIQALKACKTSAEQNAIRQANLQASIAITEALAWLAAQPSGTVTEAQMAHQLEGYYAAQPHYAGQSFNTIAGAGPHGAIVHYGTPDPHTKLNDGDLFLLDSGAQYLGGTTDATRTVCVSTPTDDQRRCYTGVLKAHLALASCVFPPGTNGAQLDGITRHPLWQMGLDYGHGTGHGVGAFLCVHEGPNGIHKAASTAFLPGMVTSIEPGYYRADWGGIRLENLALCVANQPGVPADWLAFEPLTWVPFCRDLIDADALTNTEKQQLTDYHQQVKAKLYSCISDQAKHWLDGQILPV